MPVIPMELMVCAWVNKDVYKLIAATKYCYKHGYDGLYYGTWHGLVWLW